MKINTGKSQTHKPLILKNVNQGTTFKFKGGEVICFKLPQGQYCSLETGDIFQGIRDKNEEVVVFPNAELFLNE